MNDRITVADCMQTMLNISTGHIPKHTADALGEHGAETTPALWDKLSYVHYHEHGWIVYCDTDQANAVKDEHPELATLIELARKNGADHLKLDCDASYIDGLPTFDW